MKRGCGTSACLRWQPLLPGLGLGAGREDADTSFVGDVGSVDLPTGAGTLLLPCRPGFPGAQALASARPQALRGYLRLLPPANELRLIERLR